MAATFNGLDLTTLGTVGVPQVQYANFAAEFASPQGYDGAVLSNFKRDMTTIRFDLGLAGSESARIDAMNKLVKACKDGMGELVLPNMTAGYHFDAVPNMRLEPNRYMDGFVLPLEFAVPLGCAVADVENTQNPAVIPLPTFTVGGFMDAEWTLSVSGTVAAGTTVTLRIRIAQLPSLVAYLEPNISYTFAAGGAVSLEATSDGRAFATEGGDTVEVAPHSTSVFGNLRVGSNKVVMVTNPNISTPSWSFKWRERSVW